MAQCITCGSELHPDRAKKYNYCMAPECQRKNLKGLDLVAIGVNKSAEQYMLLDQQTRDELASGKFADQRRGSFGTSLPSAPRGAAAAGAAARPQLRPAPVRPGPARPGPVRPARPAPPGPAAPRRTARPPQGVDQVAGEAGAAVQRAGPAADEIARKLGLSTYLVTQIILTSRNRGKL